jgi:ergothioneine biosynthesis protein EgtB
MSRAMVTQLPTDRSVASLYQGVRDLTEALAAPLSAEDQTVQSMPDASPTKWHRAHTSWFFETFLLQPAASGYRAFDPTYRYLFNSYYESVGERHARAERGMLSRPGIAEIGRYRRHIDEAMAALLAGPVDPGLATLAELGIQHEQQHQELVVMDIKHVLSCHPFAPSYLSERTGGTAGPRADANWLAHDGGMVEIGHPGRGDGFSFDNESPRHRVFLEPFAIADRPVTNAEWLAFMEDGGYRRPDLWLSEGWATVNAEQWAAPLYWTRRDGNWRVFTLAGEGQVTPAEPVCHVSLFEADAFARWSRRRLPTEAEWEVVAARDAGRLAAGGFLDQQELHPRCITEPQLLGSVWEWTSSSYSPYPGFRPAPGAVGEYNGKFMANQYVLRGGSCATPAGHVRTTYRNFFPARARWAFSGVRLACDG